MPVARLHRCACASLFIAYAALLPAGAAPALEDPLRVLPETLDGAAPRDMMNRWLMRGVDAAHQRWLAAYEARKTPGQIAAYQEAHRRFFLDALGGFPERTPLKPRLVGAVQRDGFRVEKVIFESQPGHYVTAALFLPDAGRHAPPYPGVLIPCGHSQNGKANEGYQKAAALLALHGMAALVFDPIDQGERAQLLDAKGKPPLWGTKAHTMVGVGAILLGHNTARFEVWDGMRGLDYLQSRPEIDAKRLGCMGNSGGGTQTAYLMALDGRIAVASPSCYVCSLYGRLLKTNGAQDAEQNIFGQLAFGMDHADYVMMRAPKPTLLCTATKDFFDIEDAWASFRHAKRVYGRLGFAERVDLAETDNKHGWHPPLREAAVRWMSRWLRGVDAPVAEPDGMKVLTDDEIRCTPKGEVMLLEGARSAYDLNVDEERERVEKRKRIWSGDRDPALAAVRALAGIRPLDQLPKVAARRAGVAEAGGRRIEKRLFLPEPGVWVPALLFASEGQDGKALPPVLYVHEKGKSADAAPGGPIDALAKAGHDVLAVDLRGTGETQQKPQAYFSPEFGPEGQDVYVAYLLGKSYVGMRAEDVLACARWLAEERKVASVRLVAVGHVGVPALHAAALEPGLFESVRVAGALAAWSGVIHARFSKGQLVNIVHGALTAYDLPDLAASLGKKLEIVGAVDAMGREVGE